MPQPLQTLTFAGTAPTITGTFKTALTPGSMIFLAYGGPDNASTIVSISDGTNSWVNIDVTVLGGIEGELWYVAKNTLATKPTITITANSIFNRDVVVVEFPGLSGLDAHLATSTLTVSTGLSSGASSPTTQNNELIIGWGVANTTTVMAGVGSGYKIIAESHVNVDVAVAMMYQIGYQAAQTASFTAGTASAWACGVATFTTPSVELKINSGLRPHAFSPGIAR